MRVIASFILLSILAAPAFAQDLVLINGSIVDGTGKARVAGNLRIRDGKIADIGVFKPAAGEMTVDVKGMIVAPGFVDLQTLSPSAIDKDAAALVTQGVTTAFLGSDGTGVYSIEDFMLPFDEKPPMLNIAMLVGHGTVRKQILGSDYKRAATPDELARMSELISDAMRQGGFGMGSDLQQEPASFSTPAELTALAKVTSNFGGSLILRIRDVKEAVALARDAKTPVQIVNAPKAALAEIDRARAQKIDVAADSYSFSQLVTDKTTTVERAVQRLSSAPAARMGLRERGVLKKGAPADVVVFSPTALASGMKYVFVNGMIVVKDGQPTDARAGQALR